MWTGLNPGGLSLSEVAGLALLIYQSPVGGNVQTRTEAQKEAAWEKAIKEAKSIVTVKSSNQMAVAKLALDVCEISWGGVSVSGKYTLTRFADEIGINFRTLSQWVGVRVSVYDKLPKNKADSVSFTQLCQVAVRVARDANRRHVSEVFEQLVHQDSFDLKMQKYLVTLKTIAYNFEQQNAAIKCSDKTLQEMLFYCKVISRDILKEKKGLKAEFHDLSSLANTHKRISANVAMGNAPSDNRADVVKDGLGGIVKLTPKDRDVLNFMKNHDWVTPTEIGVKVHGASKDTASGWALRTLNKFRGSFIERNDKGHYRWVG